MARNEKYREGDELSLPVPAGKVSGDPVRIGGLNGVLATDRANSSVAAYNPDGTYNTAYKWGGGNPDGNASVWLEGVHVFQVAFAANIGDPIYILADGSALTGTSSGNNLYGYAVSSKAAAAGPLQVRLFN
jgi:hypothetical protein